MNFVVRASKEIVRVVGGILFFLLFGFVVQAQIAAGAKNEEGIKKPQIELRLSTTTMLLCVGSAIPLDLELTNRSREEIKIDKVDLWSSFTYGYFGLRDAGRGGGMGTGCDHCRGEYIALEPNRPYQSSFKFPLDNDFFKDAGKYSIRVYVNSVSSNEVNFELSNCQ